MSYRYLLDTNTVSYAIRGVPPRVRRKLMSVPRRFVALSTFTLAELQYGLARRPGAAGLRGLVEEFLREFPIVPWDTAAARAYGDMRAAQESKGRPLSHEDLMFASHALSLGLTLVSGDTAFSLVTGLRTENWTI
jgi:tRNA(fMet)-specific endonuclease VapC